MDSPFLKPALEERQPGQHSGQQNRERRQCMLLPLSSNFLWLHHFLHDLLLAPVIQAKR
jgi:hypothetical protein